MSDPHREALFVSSGVSPRGGDNTESYLGSALDEAPGGQDEVWKAEVAGRAVPGPWAVG